MRKIFKYVLEAADLQVLELPGPSKVLSVHEQRGDMVLYAIVNEGGKNEKVEVAIRGTGHIVDFDIDMYDFIGTVKLLEGQLMFHVFTRLLI